MFSVLGAAVLLLGSLRPVLSQNISGCPGYTASNVAQTDSGLTASLTLAGDACNVYGYDLPDLTLLVEYQTDSRLHIQIFDQSETVYQVPESVVGRPGNDTVAVASSLLSFNLTQDPFSFAVQRTDSGESIFDTSGMALVFESQYVRLRTSLPSNPNIYGFGEDTDPFRRPTTDYVRTLWSRDAYLIPPGTNLYGNHPIYFEYRESTSETHGVFMLNSDGMDLDINSDSAGQYLEYNMIGGIVDLYVLAGPGPVDVARQYSDVIGQPTMMPYWGFGFHQCRYGMQDVYEVAAVVANYSAADIPLETMWTDIDYMDLRKVFTLDPDRFPLEKMQELVTYLHDHEQHYIMMVDPAVAYQNYSAFENGESAGIFLKNSDGSIYQGVVWPGITAFPDWFNPATQGYWNGEFSSFFSPTDGVDIDALWIDMNEASNFCPYPCSDPAAFAVSNDDPPAPPPVRPNAGYPIPGFPTDFQPSSSSRIKRGQSLKKRQMGTAGGMMGLPNRDLINPPYPIHDAAGSISNLTLDTNLIHSNGLAEYDTHNLFGTMMSETSRGAMLNRRPGLRPMVITRSTFAGAGRYVGHWLGDNNSDWFHYQISIAEMIAFAAIYQIPMVGSDVCGYAGDTTEELCARWAMLGAFYPFYRNHDATGVAHQEYYLWPTVTEAAQVAIKARYQLLDYIYTALYQQSVDGTPLLNPMFFLYPADTNTLSLDLQYFYGPSILVAPVTDEGATSVSVYFPNDQFYDFFTYEPLRGSGSSVTINANLTQIPVYIKGGAILPLRSDGANTTAALRELDFNLVVAPGLDGKASGSLYLDDGVSITQAATSVIGFAYDGSTLTMSGTFGYDVGNVSIADVVLLSATGTPTTTTANKPLTGGFSMSL
ncbi:hypothetical protein HO133_006453 [Letharia lupina]|uniref:Alpha-glucosidase n=1 Tax=Letharia lupina TaxID=560253 RepID=A0A8H6C7C7_9LECA|nr:uncharacterized protein HO133_006453 [Letharia lupina]KAF6218041.1 hypothetical protein HO133_006453 [Letharia lupina]